MAPAKQRISLSARLRCWLRNVAYLSILFLAVPWLVSRWLSPKGLPPGLRQKLWGPYPTPAIAPSTNSTRRPTRLWLHGVSVGEIQLLAALIEKLRHDPWQPEIILSTTTSSGLEVAQKLLPDVPKFFFPFDLSWTILNYLRRLEPSMIVLGELELWPNLVELATECKIPIAVINGRLSEQSYRGYRRLTWLTRGTFSRLSAVGVQSPIYADRFRDCGCDADRVRLTGNLKFDNVHFDTRDEMVVRLRTLIGLQPGDRVLMVGSTQDPEESAAVAAYRGLRERFPRLKLMVVPRHPERFDLVWRLLGDTSARIHRRSHIQEPLESDTWDIMLVDTIGELKWWWGLAEIAVVGGSFGSRGGQNMLEPAAYGSNVGFGPNTSNFKDIAELLLQAGAAERIPSLDALPDWLARQLDDPSPGQHRGELARQIIQEQQGASQRTISLLRDLADNQDFAAEHPPTLLRD